MFTLPYLDAYLYICLDALTIFQTQQKLLWKCLSHNLIGPINTLRFNYYNCILLLGVFTFIMIGQWRFTDKGCLGSRERGRVGNGPRAENWTRVTVSTSVLCVNTLPTRLQTDTFYVIVLFCNCPYHNVHCKKYLFIMSFFICTWFHPVDGDWITGRWPLIPKWRKIDEWIKTGQDMSWYPRPKGISYDKKWRKVVLRGRKG